MIAKSPRDVICVCAWIMKLEMFFYESQYHLIAWLSFDSSIKEDCFRINRFGKMDFNGFPSWDNVRNKEGGKRYSRVTWKCSEDTVKRLARKSRHSYFQTCLTRACRFPLPRSCRAIRTDLHGLTTDRLALSFNCRFIRNVASELNRPLIYFRRKKASSEART